MHIDYVLCILYKYIAYLSMVYTTYYTLHMLIIAWLILGQRQINTTRTLN